MTSKQPESKPGSPKGWKPGDRDGMVFQGDWVPCGDVKRSVRVVEKGIMVRPWLYNMEGLAEIPLLVVGVGTTIARGMFRGRYKVAVVDRRGDVLSRERVRRKWHVQGEDEALELARKLQADVCSAV